MAEMVEALVFSAPSREMWFLLDRLWEQQHWAWVLAVVTAVGGALLMQRRKITVGLSCVEVSVESSFSDSVPSVSPTSPIISPRTNPPSELASLPGDVALKPKMCYTFPNDCVSDWEPESHQSEQPPENSSVKGKQYGYEELDESSGWSLSVPEWARSLFQPVPLPGLYSTGATVAGHSSDDWNSILDMYSEIGSVPDWKEIASRVLPSRTVVFNGPNYLAKAKEEVVKLWGSSRRMMRTWCLAEEEGHVSALDVNERWNTVTAGTRNGYLSIWDISSGECLRSQKQPASGSVRCLKVSPEYMQVISAGPGSGSGSCVQVWDPRRSRSSVGGFETEDEVVRMESLEEEVYVREGWKVRGYDLRKLGRWFEEEEVKEEWWDADQSERLEDEVMEEGDEDDEDDGEWCQVGGGGGESQTGGKSFIARCLGVLWR